MERSARILDLIKAYIKVVTHTSTDLERNNEKFFTPWFEKMKEESKVDLDSGFYPIPKDKLGRKIPWLLLKGQGKKTIVLIHHTDTVDVDDYGDIKDLAYDPEALEKTFLSGEVDLNQETREDLKEGGWLFGRGGCDMKQGGAMHMTLLEEYSQDPDFKGNLLLLGLPDEENLSAGMRSAAYLLDKLYEDYQLDYQLMINSEPHERQNKENMVLYDGAIGKVMPICLVRGKLAHVGQIYTGFNPINLLAEIVRRTELNPDFSEQAGNTTSPAPTWLYLKDRKYVYDVSLPITAGGYMSVLPLKMGPKEILEKLKTISEEAFKKVLEDMQASYEDYKKTAQVRYPEMDYEVKVKFYDEILSEVQKKNLPGFVEEIQAFEKELITKVENNDISRAEAAFQMMEKVLSYHEDRSPMVIWGIAPPYYPSTNNTNLANSQEMEELVKKIQSFSEKTLHTKLEVQNYYTGICDLSYAMFTDSQEVIDYIENNMILWGDSYEIPLDLIKKHSMSVLNLGAWGKDFHKYTERVYLEDLVDRIPRLIDFTIKEIFRD